jgi:hypothetical protein
MTIVVKATPPMSPGRSAARASEYRFIRKIILFEASPVNLASTYQIMYGSLASKAGRKIFLEMFWIEFPTGQASQRVRTSAIIQ